MLARGSNSVRVAQPHSAPTALWPCTDSAFHWPTTTSCFLPVSRTLRHVSSLVMDCIKFYLKYTCPDAMTTSGHKGMKYADCCARFIGSLKCMEEHCTQWFNVCIKLYAELWQSHMLHWSGFLCYVFRNKVREGDGKQPQISHSLTSSHMFTYTVPEWFTNWYCIFFLKCVTWTQYRKALPTYPQHQNDPHTIYTIPVT